MAIQLSVRISPQLKHRLRIASAHYNQPVQTTVLAAIEAEVTRIEQELGISAKPMQPRQEAIAS